MADNKEQLDRYWDGFIAHVTSRPSTLSRGVDISDRTRLPGRYYFDVNSGFKFWHFSLQVDLKNRALATFAYIQRRPEQFERFVSHRLEIEDVVGETLDWGNDAIEQVARKVGRVAPFSLDDASAWPDSYEWLIDSMDVLRVALGPYSEVRNSGQLAEALDVVVRKR